MEQLKRDMLPEFVFLLMGLVTGYFVATQLHQSRAVQALDMAQDCATSLEGCTAEFKVCAKELQKTVDMLKEPQGK